MTTTRFLLPTTAMAVAILLAACGGAKQQPMQGGGPPVTVRTTVLAAGEWQDSVQALGTAKANESVTITAWESVYAIDEGLTAQQPKWIGIVDDLLVTGCRFRAMSNVLRQRFPDARITGLFIARRAGRAGCSARSASRAKSYERI